MWQRGKFGGVYSYTMPDLSLWLADPRSASVLPARELGTGQPPPRPLPSWRGRFLFARHDSETAVGVFAGRRTVWLSNLAV